MTVSGQTSTVSDPVFVCGPPRTGVRLLASILDGHPALASGPELPILVTMAQQWRDIDATLGANHEKNYGVPRDATRQAFKRAISSLFARRLERSGKATFVIHSFAAAMSIEAFAVLFPASRIIVTLRDPRAVAHSLLHCGWCNPRTGQALPYTLDALAGARFWMDFMQIVLRGATAPAVRSRVMLLRYEDLCENPSETLGQLARFLAIAPLEPKITAGSTASIIASGDAPHPPLRSGAIDTASVARWRAELDARERANIEQITGALLRTFKYAP